jgi:hypothetical protein
MRIASVLFLLLVLCIPSLAAMPAVVDPPSPESMTPFSVTLRATTCAPVLHSTVKGNIVEIETDVQLGTFCIAALVAQMVTIRIGPLPAGRYTIHPTGYTSSDDTTIFVRDVDPFVVEPFASPLSGGGRVSLQRTDGGYWSDHLTARIGGQPASILSFGDSFVDVKVPPSVATGPVDVIITDERGSWTAHAALVYYDSAKSPDRGLAEPILFPIAYSGPGVAGSQWEAKNRIVNAGPSGLYAACGGCAMDGSDIILPSGSQGDGQLVWLLRGLPVVPRFESRFRETSRVPEAPSTEVPVVRERDYGRRFLLRDIPTGTRYRTTLRVWSPSPVPSLACQVNAGAKQLPMLLLARFSPDGPLFGSVDLTPQLTAMHAAGDTTSVNVFIDEASEPVIWPMISITDNETQQVTIVWPQ